MENNPKDKAKNQAQQILKKIEAESADQKKSKAYQILQGKEKPVGQARSASWYYQMIKKLYDRKYQELIRKWKSPQAQKAIWMTGFLVISTFICWRVESKFDAMKKKASTTKTFKEAQIERQNIEINKYLSRNEFEPVPIQNEPQYKNTYKYEEEEGYFDTKDYLLEEVAKEYEEGKEVDPKMLKELQDRGFI